MKSRVTLIATRGPLAGRKFFFDEATTCIIGRSRDCTLVLPLEGEHLDVSRHHCLLEIGSNLVQVRDLDSLNGTFVNDTKIGQRGVSVAPADLEGNHNQTVALMNGDEIRLGSHTAFRVRILSPSWETSTQTLRHSSGELSFSVPVPT